MTPNIKKDNRNWLQSSHHPYRILITEGSESAKWNSLFNLANQLPDIDEFYLCAKDPNKAKYQFLVKKREDDGTKHFIDYSNDMVDNYKNIEECNPNKKIRNIKY